MKQRGLLFTTVLAASATALAGSLLPNDYDDSDHSLSYDGSDVELYVSPLQAQRRSLLPDYPAGVEPGLLALMRTDGSGQSAFSFATESALEARRVLYADIASLNPGFGREPAPRARSTQVAVANPAEDWERDWFTVPKHTAGNAEFASNKYRGGDTAGREWIQGRGDGRSVQLSAQQADSIHFGYLGRDTKSSVAQLAWTGDIAGAGGPRITGGVFLGSETPKDRDLAIGWSGRQYYGLSLESRFTAFKKHTPFASLQIARSDSEGSDGGSGATVFNPGVTGSYGYPGSAAATASSTSRREDYSRLGAGWNWQIQPNWGLRAEAYYSLNSSSGVSAYEADRSQFFFSSRYDFR